MTELEHIPFRDGEVLAVEIDGRPHIVLRPALEAIGLDYSAQRRKIQGRSWASMVPVTTVAADGSRREMVAVPIRTFLMLLATINEAHVSDGVRPALIAYQTEVADVIEAYFAKGKTPSEYQPFTWTLDETCAIIRQRYHQHHHVQSLTALFRTAGIWKQNGTPTSGYAWAFHFTGTAWTVHPYAVAKLASRMTRVTQQLQESYAIQLRLELDGAETPALTDASP